MSAFRGMANAKNTQAPKEESVTWSEQQKAVFDWAEKGDHNLVVRARAGTGKTTTIIEATARMPRDQRILMTAFNKKNAVALDQRLRHPGAVAKTMHSIGFQFVKQNWDVRVDSDRGWRLIDKCCPDAPKEDRAALKNLVEKLKSVAPFVTEDDRHVAISVADSFGISPTVESIDIGLGVPWLAASAIRVLEFGATYEDGTIDFDDMVWLPVRNKWISPQYDVLLIDEAQDTNRTGLLLAQGVCRPTGRTCVVGDDRQAIYAFRGADSNALDRLKEALNAEECGLNTTYRCGHAIVAEAQKLVPDIVAAEGNSAGAVEHADIEKVFESANPGDFILSRANAPLVPVCLRFIREGKRAYIEGRDIGRGLNKIIKKMLRGRPDTGSFMQALNQWRARETEAALTRGRKGRATAARIADQHETICALLEGLESPSDLPGRIEWLFSEAGNNDSRIMLSSVHKAKGMESDQVWLLHDTFFSRRAEVPEWADSSEEANIEYVAITRAKNSLVWLHGKP